MKRLKPMGDGRRDELGPLADQYLDRDIKSLEQNNTHTHTHTKKKGGGGGRDDMAVKVSKHGT